MVSIYDAQGRVVALGKKLGTGGEGAVCELGSDGRLVAKVYHKPVSSEKSEKLKVLAANKLDDTFAASAALAGKQLLLRGRRSLYCIAERPTK